MKIRIVLATVAIAGICSVTAIAISGMLSKEPVPLAIAKATLWTPDPLSAPRLADSVVSLPTAIQIDVARSIRPTPLVQPAFTETALPEIEPPLITWSREIASGETLDAVLANAGIAAPVRAEIALALALDDLPERIAQDRRITAPDQILGQHARGIGQSVVGTGRDRFNRGAGVEIVQIGSRQGLAVGGIHRCSSFLM